MTKKKKIKKGRGRKKWDGRDEQEVLDKLRFAWDIGATDEEAAAHAGICKDTMYRFLKKNPAFSDEKDRRKQNMILLSRAAILDGLTDQKKRVMVAMWVLENKRPEEFSKQTKVLLGEDKNRPFTGLLDAMKQASKELGLPIPSNLTHNETGKNAA